jgi:hypothetical protein
VLDMGFAPTLDAILANLPREGRQTLLFSATQTKSVKVGGGVGVQGLLSVCSACPKSARRLDSVGRCATEVQGLCVCGM